MEWLRITNLSIGSLATTVLLGVLTFYLLRSPDKTPATWLLGGYFGFTGFLALTYVLRYSVLHPVAAVTGPFSDSIVLGTALLLAFAYRFPSNTHPRESRIVTTGYTVLALGVYLLRWLRPRTAIIYTPWSHYYTQQSFLPVSVVIAVGFILTISVFLRKYLRLKGAPATPVEEGAVPMARHPSGAVGAFALLTGTTLCISLSYVLFVSGVIARETFNVIYNYGALATGLAYFVIYTNASPEFSSFRQKLVGISLATVMVVLGLVSGLLHDRVDSQVDTSALSHARLFAAEVSEGRAPLPPPGSGYLVSRGEQAGPYTIHYTADPGLTPDDLAESDRLVEENRRSARAVDTSRGGRSYRFFALEDPGTFYLGYAVSLAGRVYELGYPYSSYRQDIHRLGLGLAAVVLLSALLILLLFPLFFRESLLSPIEDLLRGVREVDRGNLDTRVPVHVNDEIGSVAQTFNRMVGSIHRANRLKDEFLASISHELRTPLNGILGIAESLRDGVAGKLSDPALANLAVIVSSGRRLARLVDDLLDFSRLKHAEISLNLTSVDVHELTEVVCVLSRPLVGAKPVVLSNRIPRELPPVRGDEGRLEQVMHNLVSNAIKFTDTGEVAIEGTVRDGRVVIEVRDTGIGIPPDRIDAIWNPFEQVDSSISRRYGGAGLGLSITRQIVEAHGGTVRVDSTLGEGSRFYVGLPLGDPADRRRVAGTGSQTDRLSAIRPDVELAVRPRVADPAGRDGHRILVVDDEVLNQQVMVNHLSPHYGVLQAYSGQEALETLEASHVDLVLLDVMMPRMSGYEASRRIRERHPPSELPIIMLTAKNYASDLVEGLESGANDYLAKPVSKTELLARIKTHLDLSQISQSYARFVPRDFLRLLAKESIVDVRLGDQIMQDMTIMFLDIRSFTTLAEKLSPQETFNFLNSYLNRISPVVRKHGGFIDKYLGDGLMALFPQNPDSAVAAATDLVTEVGVYNGHRKSAGYAPIGVGIGLHTGSLILGTIGDTERMDGTVISDSVNLTSRLEGLTKLLGTTIIASEPTMAQVSTQRARRFLGRVQVKGKSGAIAIYEVLAGDAASLAKLGTSADFEQGLELYLKGSFAEASVHFHRVAQANPEDAGAQFYLQMAAKLMVSGVPADWKGAVIIDTK